MDPIHPISPGPPAVPHGGPRPWTGWRGSAATGTGPPARTRASAGGPPRPRRRPMKTGEMSGARA